MDSTTFALAGVSDALNQERLITPELHQQVKRQAVHKEAVWT